MQLGHGRIVNRALAFVLAGGRGSRLHELTASRTKPAVFFGGQARIIDFALSNALNSGIRRIAVATQYKAYSLIRHCQQGWNFLNPERNEFVDILPASQRVSEESWYQGTADAVYQNIDIIHRYGIDYIVILAGDHIYKMDYEIMLRQHVESGADVTVACMTVPRDQARAFGVMQVDETGRIVDFVEKPADPPGLPENPSMSLASMGIYVFKWSFLFQLLAEDAADPNSSHDFGNDILPRLVAQGRACAHRFEESCVRASLDAPPYWRDVGTLDAFWEANINLTEPEPELDLRDGLWPITSHAQSRASAKLQHDRAGNPGHATDSVIASGCVIRGSFVRNSLLFAGVETGSRAQLEQATVLPNARIGDSVRLRKAVVDTGVCIPDGLVAGEDPADDARRFRRSKGGVVLITQPMIDMLDAE